MSQSEILDVALKGVGTISTPFTNHWLIHGLFLIRLVTYRPLSPNRINFMKKHNKYAEIGLIALKRAAAKVAEDARKNKYKIPIWRDGRIEFEIPAIISEKLQSPDGNKRGGADA